MECQYISCWQLVLQVDKLTLGVHPGNLTQLLDGLGFDYISHHRRLSAFGVINPIFFITAKNRASPFGETELVLRLSNPHPYWETRKTLGVARAITFLGQHSSVALPKILSWSCDGNNALGCPYDLALKVPGVELETVLKDESVSQETKMFLGTKVIEQVLLLKDKKLKTQLGDFPLMGMFTNISEGHSLSDMSPGPLMIDGPPLGPFQDIKHWVQETVQWGLRMLTTPPLESFRADFEPSLQHFLDHYFPSLSFPSNDCELCHTDLNPGNIMIDPHTNTITALLDWDGAGYLPPEFEFPSLLDCMEDCCGSKEAGLQLLQEHGISTPPGYQQTEVAISVAQQVNWMNFWCSTWWTSKPGERELITQDNAEYLSKCVRQKEGLNLMKLLDALGCWKPTTNNQDYLTTNPMPLDFQQTWAQLNGEPL